MNVDPDAAIAFLVGHGRLLDRRRLDHVLGRGSSDEVVAALDAYRNLDGGYGWGLEPDLRSPESQPAAAMHALEVFARTQPSAAQCRGLFDWLGSVSLPDGGLPFARPVTSPAGCAAWWLNADSRTSSLQMTTQVTANAHRVALGNVELLGHPWLVSSTAWCLRAVDTLDRAPNAFELLFTIDLLDALQDGNEMVGRLLDRMRRFVPVDGIVEVEGGVKGEVLRPLDFAPRASGAARGLFSDGLIAAELERLVSTQEPDGGWTVTFVSATPRASLDWRGDATTRAISILADHGLLDIPRRAGGATS